jgi:competence protein ComEC
MRRVIVAILALLLLLVPHLGSQQAAPLLRVHFVDVGQGDGVLIQSPSGQNVVYDGGENPERMRDYLAGLGITEVGLVIASHNHADHIGGLASVLRAYPPPFVMDNGLPATTQSYAGFLDAAATAGSQLLEPTQRRIQLGDAALQIIEPPGIPAWEHNDNSIGVVVEYGAFRLSLNGDAEEREWAWWLTHLTDLFGAVHVHKASHHGSVNGDTAAGISKLSPEVVIVSAGAGNSYGHPDAQALRLYSDAGATVYRSDVNGTIIVEADASGAYTVRVERGEGAQPPPATPSPTPTPTPFPTPAPIPVPTPAPTGFSLSGLVRDATNFALLPGVAVRILDGTNANRSTTTDAAGAYGLASLQTSGFTVSFSLSGYTTATRGITLTQNTSLDLSLNRTPTPSPSPAPSPSPSPNPGGRFRIGAVCRDGTLSNATGSGACSSHGGVACWRYSDGTCTNP